MRKPLLVASIIVHAGAFTALAISSMWKIEKLPLEDRGGVTASFALPRDTGGGAAPARQEMVAKKPKVKPKDRVQPERRKEEQQVTTDAVTTDVIGTSTSGAPGNGTGGDGMGESTPTAGCEQEPCTREDDTTTKKIEKKEEVPKKKTKGRITIPESEATRISGNTRIEAPNNVKIAMQRAGDSKVYGTIKVCADTRGNVTSATVARSTGYPAYDDKLVSEMSDWQYKPEIRDGEATAFCTLITLVYVMR